MKIIIAAGGSGGHIFPAIALARELEDMGGMNIVFAASKRKLDRDILSHTSYRKVFFSVNPMPYGLGLRVIPFIFKVVRDCVVSLSVLIKERPKVIVGFGGYTSGMIVLIGALLGVKTLIHEQNYCLGRANKILDRLVSLVAVSFDETRSLVKNKNVVVTGNPLRRIVVSASKHELPDKFGLDDDRFTVLVVGGSQGAHGLNKVVTEALISLDERIKNELQILHIAGPGDFEYVSKVYAENNVMSKVFSFIENIHDAYSICDVAVSRSGAACIFELALYGRPMLLVPYPSKKNSQRLNAKYFSDRGAAVIKDEEMLDSREVKDIIVKLLKDKIMREHMSKAALNLARPNAAEDLAKQVKRIASD